MGLTRRTLLILALQWLSIFSWAENSSHKNAEHEIKAVFLYKFPAYIDWPSSVFQNLNDPLVIGVIDADEIFLALTALDQKTALAGRPVQVKNLNATDDLENIHILFIGQQQKRNLPRLLKNVRAKPILTVTESRGALEIGSIINFVPVGDYIRFEISTASAEINNIKISARLLDIAQRIDERRPRQ